MPEAPGDPLGIFDEATSAWFRSSVGTPTDVQAAAWSLAAAGRDVLVTAPTGSGKTLAAFLFALDSLLSGRWPADGLSVLYVSPLKALNNDIRRNLLVPLAGIRGLRLASGRAAPDVRVETRSGDTTARERRGFLSRPPSVLATTPESLALLLNSPRARENLRSVRMLVLDEIHALESGKRGTYLMAQVERLRLLCGDPVLVALSATVADPESTARFAGGWAEGPDGGLRPRPVEIVRSSLVKRRKLSVRYPSSADDAAFPGTASPSRWPLLIDAFVDAALRNRTTLIFTNSRRHAEKIAFLMNERADRVIAWAHHGSLSREVRADVEERLKSGALPAVVATGSLELGIDVGSVDEVLLVGTPFSAAATLQRIGRAGHSLGAESRARLFPLHGMDLLLAAAQAGDVAEGRLEAERRPRAPLDVLAQLVLSMASVDDWREDDLFRFVRRGDPYRSLERDDFDAVLAMLRGRYADGRLPALSPRLERSLPAAGSEGSADSGPPPGVLRATPAVPPLLYRSGGVIPDRGSFVLRLAEGKVPVGELDEEFVWERRLGDSFALGSRAWRIVGMDDRSVSVVPSDRGINIVPFWRAESLWRSKEAMAPAAELIAGLPSEAAEAAASGGTADVEADASYLAARAALDGESALSLARFLRSQRASCLLPGPRRFVLESFSGPAGAGLYCFLHTLRGGRVNAALGIALRAAADEAYGRGSVELFWDDVGVLASFPALEDGDEAPAAGSSSAAGPACLEDLLARLGSRGVAPFLRSGLEETGLFGAAFREAAGRALLLPKASFGKRTPLWVTRARSKRLYDAVRGFADFPVVKEAWRACLQDILDLEGAEAAAAGLADGSISLALRDSAAPSPFARGAVWINVDGFMYRRDDGSAPSALSDELLAEYLAPDSSPAPVPVDGEAAARLAARSSRRDPDYLPRDWGEAADWLDERGAMAAADWEELLDAVGRAAASGGTPSPRPALPGVRTVLDGAREPLVLSPDLSSGGASSDAVSAAALLPRWLRYEGPAPAVRIEALFGEAGLAAAEAALADGAFVLVSADGGEPAYCEAEYAARLVRASRAERRRAAETAVGAGSLQLLRARAQGLLGSRSDAAPEPAADASPAAPLRGALEPLLGLALPAEAWEREVLPARLDYKPYLLDLLCGESRLVWFGAGEGRAGFALEDELDAASRPPFDEAALSPEAASVLAALDRGGADSFELATRAGLDPRSAAAALRELARAGLARTGRFRDAPAALARDVDGRSPAAADSPAPRPAAGRRPAAGLRPPPRGAFPTRDRWSRDRFAGEPWFRLPPAGAAADALDRAVVDRERARALLARHVVVSRSLLALEDGAPPWSQVFRALRLLEFAGEAVGGRFVEGLDEIQFVAASSVPLECPAGSGLYCLSAKDPASLCGLGPAAAALGLPPRASGVHLVWRGAELLLVSRRSGRDLEFRAAAAASESEAAAALMSLSDRLLRRAVDPLPFLLAETVDGVPALASPRAALFAGAGFVEGRTGFELHPSRR